MEAIQSHFRKRLEGVKHLFSIPPFSESMAGVIILFNFTNSVATSIWMFNAWSPFVFTLFNGSNLYVGLMAAAHGCCNLTFAMISGHLADTKVGHSQMLLYAVRFGLVTLTTVLVAIWTESLFLLVLSQCFEGIYMGLSFTCMESVFAQCLRRGERDRLYSVKFSGEASGPIVGLVLSAILYSIIGDHWEVSILRYIMTFGVALHLFSMLNFLYYFKPLPWVRKRKAGEEEPSSTGGEGLPASANPPPHQVEDVVVLDPQASGVPSLKSPSSTNATMPGPREEDIDSSMTTANGGTRTEDARLEDEEESLLGDLPGPSTEIANRARTALLSSAVGAPRVSSQFDPSTCTPAPETQEEIMRDLYRSFGSRQGEHEHEHENSHANTTAASSMTTEPQSLHHHLRHGSLTVVHHNATSTLEKVESPARVAQLRDDANNGRVRAVRIVDTELENATGLRRKVMECIPFHRYPLVVALADIVITVGSGMTTQYFTLFMMILYGIAPAQMALLNLCTSCMISVLAIVNGIVGRRYGRARAIIPPKTIGAFVLLWMALARGSSYAPTWLMCIAFVVRMACMNCSAGLSRALIMDIVPETSRGRWNAIESIQSAGWSGTALIGGYLADHWGYGAAFIITFFFHLVGISMFLPLLVRNDTKLPVEVIEDDEEEEEDGMNVDLKVKEGLKPSTG